MTLAHQTAIITGASAGLGHATALAFARQGAKLLVTARREERLIALCNQIRDGGGVAEYVVGDAALETTAASVTNAALKHFGQIDHLINNAGIGHEKPFFNVSVEEYDQIMDTNVKSGFLFSRAVLPHMVERRSGNILFVSSVAGLQGPAHEAVYSASKFAQSGMAQSLDAEFRKHNIKIGCFFPGGIKTEFALGNGRTEESVATSHMMNADDVAEAVLFISTRPVNARVNQMTLRHMG